MNLKEMVNTMMPSDRLIVKDTYGEELYRGYAANYDNTQQQALKNAILKNMKQWKKQTKQ